MSKEEKEDVKSKSQTKRKTVQAEEKKPQDGMVEIELLMAHGNCKKGAKRKVTENQARVLCDKATGPIAKIVD